MSENQKGVIVKLRVATNSSRFKLEGGKLPGNELRVSVCSQPRNGKANKELLKELKNFFDSSVEILRGEKSNRKIVLVHASKEHVLAALNNHLEKP